MDAEKRKRLIIFTSQSFKQKGIRATRMDAIAHGLNISKRTIYEVYKTKDNLIGGMPSWRIGGFGPLYAQGSHDGKGN